MNTTDCFIHLRLHSEFSITDGLVRLNQAVATAVAHHMPALGLSDLMNVFGVVKFYRECRSKGIKPIIGCDIWLENEEERDQPYRLLLIAKNRTGYGQLCQLLTRAYLHNQYRNRAEIKREWLEETDTSQLIALSGAHTGDIGRALLSEQWDEAEKRSRYWGKLFPNSFYLEIQRLDNQITEKATQLSVWLAEKTQLPIVATHPIQFMEPDDFKAHEARVCIAEGYTLGNPRRPKLFEPCQHFLSTHAMLERFHDIPEAIENTIEIAKRCNLSIELGHSHLPDFPTPDGMSLEDYLVSQSQQGLELRLAALFPDETIREKERTRYDQRLAIECKTIIQMGFPGYFLIVADFINWAKNHECPVGPGRGSGAGSLVAYSLGITDIDPLAYALLFERFLNPERVSMPDFDIDFCQDNRYRVINYVRHQYGAEAVSQIATFGTMASKAVIRDVGRVLDLPYSFCDTISKLIPSAPGKQYSLSDAAEMEPTLKERLQRDSEEELRELWQLAQKLEGLTRNIGMHAGGVLIAPGKITDFCPMYQASAEEAVPVSMLDKDDVEKVGLVKFDFLGLRNLTIIKLALDYIKKIDPSFDVDLYQLPFTDPAAYKVLQQANTTAVFQLESDGMKRLLEKLKPDRFEDIIAVLALYRPGPLGSGMVDDFILRKAGKQAVDYFHPDLKTCLEPTYGVILYQEQVMQISQILGGYTLGEADLLRRAMGKKKPEEMAAHREKIAAGAQKNGYDPALAEMLFDLMAKFAEYGFNKSHTAAYAVISYQTAWLKAHYTAPFMAATMSSELDNTDQLKVFYDDCTSDKNQLEFLPPDINASYYRFIPLNNKQIRYALGAIKGSGEAAVEHIIQEREKNGAYKDLFDFCLRTDKRLVNKRTIEALIRAGAFDRLHANRAQLLANIEMAMERAEQSLANTNQTGLFDFDEQIAPYIPMQAVAPWQPARQLAEEKAAVGFYLSGHPFTPHKQDIQAFIKTTLSELSPSKETVLFAGFATSIRYKIGNRGRMAFITLEDERTKVEVGLFGERYEAYQASLKEDSLLIIEGKVSEDHFNGGIRLIANKLLDLSAARSRFARGLLLQFTKPFDIDWLKQTLTSFHDMDHGNTIHLHYQNNQAKGQLLLGSSWRVKLEDELIEQLGEQFGHAHVQILW